MKFLNKISSSNFGSINIGILCLGLFKEEDEKENKIQLDIHAQIVRVEKPER